VKEKFPFEWKHLAKYWSNERVTMPFFFVCTRIHFALVNYPSNLTLIYSSVKPWDYNGRKSVSLEADYKNIKTGDLKQLTIVDLWEGSGRVDVYWEDPGHNQVDKAQRSFTFNRNDYMVDGAPRNVWKLGSLMRINLMTEYENENKLEELTK